MDIGYIIWIPLIPLAVFLLLGFLYIGVAGLTASTVLSFKAAYEYFFVNGNVDGVYQTFTLKTVWMNFTETLQFDMGILVDSISVMMLVVVSTVSLMVNVYSRGYMKGDPGINKFFAFLSLFTFSMYGLVLATNLFQIYVFF